MFIILVGALILNTEYSIIEVILGSVGSILLGCIIQFFVFQWIIQEQNILSLEDGRILLLR